MAGPGHYVAFALVAAAALAAGALLGRRLAGNRRASAWALGAGVLALVLYVVCRWQPAWEVRIFPWTFYAFWQRQWVYAPGIFVVACGGAMLPVRWNRLTVWAAAAAILAFSMWEGRWLIGPLCPGKTDLPVRGAMVTQSTDYTCAPAACATVLAAWGIEKSEHEMAQLCLCAPEKGTSQFDVYRGLGLAAEGSGLKARLVAVDRKELARLVRPFTIGSRSHAIVVFAVREGWLLIGDPLNGRIDWCEAGPILDHWDGTAELLCREDPFDGGDAPRLGEWRPAADSKWTERAMATKEDRP